MTGRGKNRLRRNWPNFAKNKFRVLHTHQPGPRWSGLVRGGQRNMIYDFFKITIFTAAMIAALSFTHPKA